MILWTIIPVETILEDTEDEGKEFVEVAWQGATLLVEPTGRASGRVERLISTDPVHYLNPSVQPGVQIRWVPVLRAGQE